MIAPRRTISQKSTTVRSKSGLHQRALVRRDGSARLPRIWGGCGRRQDALHADRPLGFRTAADAGRLEPLVTGLLTLIASGYALAVLIRVVAMYG